VKVGCLVALLLFGLAMRSCINAVTTPPPRPVDSELLQAWGHRAPALADLRGLPRVQGAPYARGKLVVIAISNERGEVSPSPFAEVNYELPAERIATKFEEVGTVVLARYESLPAGSYDDGAPAYRVRAHLTLVDRTLPAILAETVLEGAPPPKTVVRSKGEKAYAVTGEIPDGGVAGWIERLPRK